MTLGDQLWDWDVGKLKPCPAPPPYSPRESFIKRMSETFEEKADKMLLSLAQTAKLCCLCSLGRKLCTDHDTTFDPHVFSNMKPNRWMVVGQNPGFNEVLKGEPFVGDAGNFFASELKKHGFWRSNFYISNTIKCYTKGNARPTPEEVLACEPILRMEIGLLRPILVVTLGSVAFDIFCSDKRMSDHLGEIVKSGRFGVQVYPIYHPSPRNMAVSERKQKFGEDIKNLCKLIRAYEKKHPAK